MQPPLALAPATSGIVPDPGPTATASDCPHLQFFGNSRERITLRNIVYRPGLWVPRRSCSFPGCGRTPQRRPLHLNGQGSTQQARYWGMNQTSAAGARLVGA